MDSPFFSIVIPAYNREKFIGQAIDSVLAQEFTAFEILVVDDASTDNTYGIIKGYTDPRVKLIKQKENKERGAARNAGVQAATGRYICYLDSDDRFLPNHLSNFYYYIEQTNFPKQLWFSNTMLETKEGISERPQPAWDEKNKFGYLLRYTFSPCRVCVAREIAIEFPFDEYIPGIEDLDNWLHIATKYPIQQLIEYTAVYVDHEASYSDGDVKRFEKELCYFQKIFSKKTIAPYLPAKQKKYLVSKCHYHLAIKNFQMGKKWKIWTNTVRAFFYYPSGYNCNANRTMFVMCLVSLPLVGFVIKQLVSKTK